MTATSWTAHTRLALCLLAAVSACRTPPVGRPPSSRVPYAVLNHVPASATHALVVSNLTSVGDGIRAFVEPLRVLNTGYTVEALERELRKELGLSPLDQNELDEAGFDLAGEAVLFGQGADLTMIVSISDAARVDKWIADIAKRTTTYVKAHQGHSLTSWKSGTDVRGTVLRFDRYLLAHVASRPPHTSADDWKPDESWLDEILAVKRRQQKSLASDDRLAWAVGEIPQRDIFWFVDTERVTAASANRVRPPRDTSCSEGDAQLPAQISRIAVGAAFGKRQAQVQATFQLTESARAKLAAKVVATTARAGLPAAIWDSAPLRMDWQIDPQFVDELVTQRPRCGYLPPFVPWFVDGTEWLGLLLRNYKPLLAHLGGSVQAVLLSSDERGEGTLHVRGAAVGSVRTDASRQYLRGQMPPEEGKKQVIAGREVVTVKPSVTLAEVVRYSLADNLLRLTAGEDLMTALLKPIAAAAPSEALKLAELRVLPTKIADLRAALKLSGDSSRSGYSFYQAGYAMLDKLANLASSYAELQLGSSLMGSRVVLTARYRLR